MPEIWPITLIGTPHSPQALPFRFPFFWFGSLTFPFARIFHILATVLLGPGRMMRLRAFRSLFACATRNDRIAVEFRSRVSLNYCAEKGFEFTMHIHNTLSLFVAVCRRLSSSLLSPKQLSLWPQPHFHSPASIHLIRGVDDLKRICMAYELFMRFFLAFHSFATSFIFPMIPATPRQSAPTWIFAAHLKFMPSGY